MNERTPEDILTYNTRLYGIGEFLRAFQLWIPIWVAYELRYITLGQLPIIEAVSNGMQLVLELPTGAFADMIGKKISMLIGVVISTIGVIIFYYARSFQGFLVYALFFGIGASLYSGASEAFLYDSAIEAGREKDFGKSYAKVGMYSQISLAVATLLGGILSLWSYDIPIIVTAIAIGASTIAILLYREPYKEEKKFTILTHAAKMRDGFLELFRTTSTTLMSAFYIAVGGITWVCALMFNTTMLTTIGHSTLQIGIFYFIARIINSVLLFKVFHIEHLMTKRRAVLLFPIIMLVGLLPGLWLSKWWVMASVWLVLFSTTARWVLLAPYTNAEFDSKKRATALSALSMSIGIIYVVVALISGPLMQTFGSPKIIYTGLGVLTLLTVVPLSIKIRSMS
jgi:MFS family permease